MSIEVMSHVWKHSQLKGSQLLLLLAIADHARHDGTAWPSIDHLAEKTRMSRRQTISNIHAIVETGELRVMEQGGRGARDTTRYQVMMKGAEIAPIAPETRVQSSPNKGAVSVDKGAVFDNKGAIATAPESINHQLEPSDKNRNAARASRRGSLTPIPDDFQVSDEIYDWALEKGLPAGAVDLEFEKFVNHALSIDRRVVRWELALKNWLLKTSQDLKQGRGPGYRAGAGIGGSRAEDPDRRNWDADKWFEG